MNENWNFIGSEVFISTFVINGTEILTKWVMSYGRIYDNPHVYRFLDIPRQSPWKYFTIIEPLRKSFTIEEFKNMERTSMDKMKDFKEADLHRDFGSDSATDFLKKHHQYIRPSVYFVSANLKNLNDVTNFARYFLGNNGYLPEFSDMDDTIVINHSMGIWLQQLYSSRN